MTGETSHHEPSDQLTVSPAAMGDGIGPPPVDDRIEIRSMRIDDRDVVVKAASATTRAAVRRESEVLERLSQEPVVDLVGVREGADHTELTTRRHGTVTLGEVGLLGYEHRGRALVSACAALDALHDAGWTHGSLEPSHVLVDQAGEVRFCSLGRAEELATATGTSVADDREALDSIVRGVLEAEGGFGGSRERRAWHRASKRALGALSTRRGLLDGSTTVAVLRDSKVPGTLDPPEAGNGSDPAAEEDRPVIRRRGLPGRDRSGPRGALRLKWGWTALVPAVLVAVVTGAAAARLFDPAEPAPADRCEVELEGTALGCGSIEVDDNFVRVGTTRFEVGQPGDSVAVGDWDCDGLATVLLLDLDEGSLWEFADWAAPNRPVHGSLVGTFAGATALVEKPPECAYPDVLVGERR